MNKERASSNRGGGGKQARPAINAHVRVSGLVRIGPRTAMLEADDGHLWRLSAEEDLAAHADQRATVEGRVSAADSIAVLWIGAEGGGEAGQAPE